MIFNGIGVGRNAACKKGYRFSCPQAEMSSLIRLFPARVSLVSDIPAGDRKIDNLLYSALSSLLFSVTVIYLLLMYTNQMRQRQYRTTINN
jgi:hypothetical protein